MVLRALTGSLRFKLNLALLLAGIFPLAVIGIFSDFYVKEALELKAVDYLHSHAEQVLFKLDDQLAEYRQDLITLTENSAVQGTPQAVTELANRTLRLFEEYELILVADAEGRILAASTVDFQGRPVPSQQLIGQSAKGEAWFEGALRLGRATGATFADEVLEDPWISRLKGEKARAVSFSAPVYDATGTLLRVWSNRLSYERITRPILDRAKDLLRQHGVQTIEAVLHTGSDRAPGAAQGTVEASLQSRPHGSSPDSQQADYQIRTNALGVLQIVGHSELKASAESGGLNWRLDLCQDLAEAQGPLYSLRARQRIISLAILILVSAAAVLLAKRIATPVVQAASVIQSVAGGDFSGSVRSTSQDEVGQMAQALNETLASLKQTLGAERVDWKLVGTQRREAEQFNQMMDASPTSVLRADRDLKITYLNKASLNLLRQLAGHLSINPEKVLGSSIDLFHKNPEKQRRLLADPKNLPVKTVIQIGPEFADLQADAIRDKEGNHVGTMVTWSLISERLATERREREGNEAMKRMVTQLAENATALAAAAEELSAISSQMTHTATETSNQAGVASAASEQVNKSVQAVASGTEEMSASIREISSNASEATRMAQRAVETVEKTNASMVKLGESSNEIGEIIDVINTIAEQTNLLALNATIEAARAGEAGKGFAVVANEVKELAKETAKATENIKNKIKGIQEESGGAIEAIRLVTEGIAKMTETFSSIAAAVEEQTATANEISRSLGEVAQGSEEITRNIHGVAKSAQETSSGAEETRKAASELAQLAAALQQLVQAR